MFIANICFLYCTHYLKIKEMIHRCVKVCTGVMTYLCVKWLILFRKLSSDLRVSADVTDVKGRVSLQCGHFLLLPGLFQMFDLLTGLKVTKTVITPSNVTPNPATSYH